VQMLILVLQVISISNLNILIVFRFEEDNKLLSNGSTSKQPNLPRVRLSNTETMTEKSR